MYVLTARHMVLLASLHSPDSLGGTRAKHIRTRGEMHNGIRFIKPRRHINRGAFTPSMLRPLPLAYSTRTDGSPPKRRGLVCIQQSSWNGLFVGRDVYL